MIRYYILENGLPKPADLETWSKWVETHPNRDIARTILEEEKIEVITVFFQLPEIDLDFPEEGSEPRQILWMFGTLVRGGPMDGHEIKYKTREEAEDGHKRILAQVKEVLAGGQKPDCCGNG